MLMANRLDCPSPEGTAGCGFPSGSFSAPGCPRVSRGRPSPSVLHPQGLGLRVSRPPGDQRLCRAALHVRGLHRHGCRDLPFCVDVLRLWHPPGAAGFTVAVRAPLANSLPPSLLWHGTQRGARLVRGFPAPTSLWAAPPWCVHGAVGHVLCPCSPRGKEFASLGVFPELLHHCVPVCISFSVMDMGKASASAADRGAVSSVVGSAAGTAVGW